MTDAPNDLLAGLRETLTRRHFLCGGSHLLAGAALADLARTESRTRPLPFAPKAKHVIYLHMVGGPPQMDMFDPKPGMAEWYDKDLPESVRNGQRLTTMTSGQARFPIAPSKYSFQRHGECGMELTELLPYLGRTVDRMCFVRSVHTDAINHEPAITFLQTGNQITGRPCLGAWASYGLGSMNADLPTFVVMVARPTNQEQMQAISARLWASGALPGEHAGVSFRTAGDPILFLENPDGVSDSVRRRTLDGIGALNQRLLDDIGDPATRTRMEQYELAYRMQASVPDLADLSTEPDGTWTLYGDEARKPGTFANTALMARRMVERGVRFVQVYHNNWDTHANVAGRLPDQCRDIDQPCHALILDLERRGLLDETLIVWGGEFGRTIYSQGGLSRENYGRDHHPRCFTMWMAGGGVRPGHIHGETDEFSYNIVRDPVNVHDLHATMLHQLGLDHERLTVRHQGLDLRLTGVEPAKVLNELLA
ncbi:MAG: DUF1501 domain-containing protein [Planctomycetota bacterium]